VKLVGLLADRSAAPRLSVPHQICHADPTDAVLAANSGAQARPQIHAGVVFAWPRNAVERDAAEAALGPHVSALYPVEEVLHWDELGDAPNAVVLTYLVRRRADLSFAAFQSHYRERHAPLARIHHPGIARYVQNYVAPGAGDPPPIDAISELWFKSEVDARTRFYRDDESRRVIAEDVRRFVDLRGGGAFAARPRPA
jgi:uncharacterized protein (TIGR02118 family)